MQKRGCAKKFVKTEKFELALLVGAIAPQELGAQSELPEHDPCSLADTRRIFRRGDG